MKICRSEKRRLALFLVIFISCVWAYFLWADHTRWGGTLYLNGAGESKRAAADASEYYMDNPRDRLDALLRKSPGKEVRAFVIFDGYYPAEAVFTLPCDRVYTLYVIAPDIGFRYAYALSSPVDSVGEALAAFTEAVQKSVELYEKGEYLHMFSDGNSTPQDVLGAYANGTLYIKSVSVEDTAQNLKELYSQDIVGSVNVHWIDDPWTFFGYYKKFPTYVEDPAAAY
ncbi:MAG TPA: hypothetical protein VN369_02835 [Terriglobales bacterium]|nr:hypothetical protein [Terriglobales bacterium]